MPSTTLLWILFWRCISYRLIIIIMTDFWRLLISGFLKINIKDIEGSPWKGLNMTRLVVAIIKCILSTNKRLFAFIWSTVTDLTVTYITKEERLSHGKYIGSNSSSPLHSYNQVYMRSDCHLPIMLKEAKPPTHNAQTRLIGSEILWTIDAALGV